MPIIKDPQGNIIAKMPYNEGGEQAAEKMVADNPNLDIDYGENNVTDASKMRENYQLGGLIPGQPGFGQRPIVSPPVPPVPPIMEEGGEVPEYKKGGKTKKSKKDIPIGSHAKPIQDPSDWKEDPHKVETEWKGYGHDPKTGYTRSVSKQPGKRKFKTKKKK